MGLQLILCVEANSQSKSDYIYIKETIDYFYEYGLDVKISPVYMNGKGNYNSRKIMKKINELISQYKGNGLSQVIYFIDVDHYLNDPQDQSFLKEIESFCSQNKYNLVWFVKDIEDVYLGQTIKDNHKIKYASLFKAKKQIKDINTSMISSYTKRANSSNILKVLDQYLNRKKEKEDF